MNISEKNKKKVDNLLGIIGLKLISELEKKTTGSLHFSIDISEGGVKDRLLLNVKESHNLGKM